MEGRDWVQHFGLIMPRLAQACPTLPDFAKWGFHSFYENLVHWCALFIVYNESPYGPLSSEKTACLGKIWFSSYGPKCSRPIRLQESLVTYISWRGWSLTLIFCMQVDIHGRKRLNDTLGWSCPDLPRHARLCPILPVAHLDSWRGAVNLEMT